MTKTYKIKLLKSIQETSDIYVFTFKKPKNYNWISGQYAIFTFENLKTNQRKSRTFSICSSKDENAIIISTKIENKHSDFKEALLNMKKNDEITISEAKGEFVINEDSKQIIGIAGGIGITPFRAILHDLPANTNLILLYSDIDKNYAYIKELEKYNMRENIDIRFISTIDDTNKKTIKYASQFKNNAKYFISGPPIMVESIKKLLEKNNIQNIKYDPFYGY